MIQKEINLYEDSVIKLTVKQGTEDERFPSTDVISDEYITNPESYSGSFSSGELAWTRDTNRLFVGNISEDLKPTQQQTLGGVLSGNKYLGYIDSRNQDKITLEPEILFESTENGENKGLLSQDSLYRSYNFIDDSGNLKITEDKKWPKFTYYNKKYDAYDGDYMYDTYRNALILFDHNISNEKVIDNIKHKTPLYPLYEDESSDISEGKKIVHNFTKDMYGDGYVLLYNIVPDGETITFKPKNFNSDSDTKLNYSYNVIKINNVPSESLVSALDINLFKNEDGKIKLRKKYAIQEEFDAHKKIVNDDIESLKGQVTSLIASTFGPPDYSHFIDLLDPNKLESINGKGGPQYPDGTILDDVEPTEDIVEKITVDENGTIITIISEFSDRPYYLLLRSTDATDMNVRADIYLSQKSPEDEGEEETGDETTQISPGEDETTQINLEEGEGTGDETTTQNGINLGPECFLPLNNNFAYEIKCEGGFSKALLIYSFQDNSTVTTLDKQTNTESNQ